MRAKEEATTGRPSYVCSGFPKAGLPVGLLRDSRGRALRLLRARGGYEGAWRTTAAGALCPPPAAAGRELKPNPQAGGLREVIRSPGIWKKYQRKSP